MNHETSGIRNIFLWIVTALVLIPAGCRRNAVQDYPIQPVSFTQVRIQDGFWLPRMEINRKVTIPFAFKKSEETGRIDNFAKAGGLLPGDFQGRRYDDSDVFKIMEGAAYSLSLHRDPELERYMDDLIAKIAAAQEDDGYLYTTRTIDPDNPAPGAGDSRWSNLGSSHELYNVGHMYEAAAAYFLAMGKRAFLDVALKNADLIDRVFGPDKRSGYPGHQEIEIGLVKLYRITGEKKYLDLAKYFLDERGPREDRKQVEENSSLSIYNQEWYLQAHQPVVDQKEAVGHAVRAAYMYSGMADVAALTGDTDYIGAIDRIWEDVAAKKLYLTGGIGARHEGESFGAVYELPNATAYNETCAAIANVFWNHRLFLLKGDAKYIDVLERTLYNGLISGVSLSGDLFFYPNPLESDGISPFNQGALSRKPWFDCACCPVNVARFIPSLPGYVYAVKDDSVYVNLYIAGSGTIDLGKTRLTVKQDSLYPWEGKIDVSLDLPAPRDFSLCLRIPGWARRQPVPGDLYRYLDEDKGRVGLKLNGRETVLQMDKGYAVIKRRWEKGDKVELNFPMPVRRVIAHEKVSEDMGKVALERGPLVFAVEGVDNDGGVLDRSVSDGMVFVAESRPDLLGGIYTLKGSVPGGDMLTAIPYYAWSHRGEGEMAVWLMREPGSP